MQPENAIRGFDLGRFDEVGMRDRDRMHDTFERFLPRIPKKPAILGNLGRGRSSARRRIAAARDGQGAGTGCSRWSDRTPLAASEDLATSRGSPGSLMGPSFSSYLGYGKPRNKYCS